MTSFRPLNPLQEKEKKENLHALSKLKSQTKGGEHTVQ